jgi:hypothetical protein
MTYKTILVSLNELQRNQTLLESAAGQGQDLDAYWKAFTSFPAVEPLFSKATAVRTRL